MKWEKIGRAVKSNGESTVTYSNGNGTTIESRKRHVPHANGVGYWTHTTYWVLVDGIDVVEKYSLSEASKMRMLNKGDIMVTDIDFSYLEVIDNILALPSADAVHGEWIIHGEPPWLVRECSICGTKWHHWSGYSSPNYCGHCGARMKGGDE